MNQFPSTTATVIRSVISRRGLRAVMLAGVAAASIGTATAASASTVHAGSATRISGHHVRPNGWVPVEECLNWSGTVKYFPALTATSKSVNAVLNATLSNCSLDGTPQTFSGTVFGALTGTATKSGATLTGNVAVTWPQDAGLNPTIASISLNTSSGVYSFNGSITAGAFAGNQLWGSYEKTGQSAFTGGISEKILGSAPFAAEENLG
ncbi:MAG TPA: hypothetical protein VHY58_01095 [Streptosporangiaceae bacterium]|jgi:hypothetical protein|nr:hypothetical protein [Streptosporangiaceae bacterium]